MKTAPSDNRQTIYAFTIKRLLFSVQLGISKDGDEVKGPHKVLELTPPNIWGLQIHYTIVAYTTWKLTPVGDSTKATVNIEYNFTESGNKAVDKEVRFLKQVLETVNIPEASLRRNEQW